MDSTMGQWRGIDPSLYWTPQSWSRFFLPRSPSCIISSSWLLHSHELGMDFRKQQWLVHLASRHAADTCNGRTSSPSQCRPVVPLPHLLRMTLGTTPGLYRLYKTSDTIFKCPKCHKCSLHARVSLHGAYRTCRVSGCIKTG